jgi:hypothetical protein
MSPDLHAAAISYASLGIPVFPCLPGSKEPATEHGFHDATTDLDQIDRWWKRNPHANIGGECGVKFDVLDFDVKIGIDGTIHKDSRPLMHRLNQRALIQGVIGIAETRHNGLHFLYPPSGLKKASLGKLHVDFQAAGSYVILPPSIVPPDDGIVGQGCYRWTEPIDLQADGRPLDWLAVKEHLTPKVDAYLAAFDPVWSTFQTGRIDGLKKTVLDAVEGERNARLFWAACRAYEEDLDVEELRSAAHNVGLSDGEITKTLKSAKAEAAKGARA